MPEREEPSEGAVTLLKPRGGKVTISICIDALALASRRATGAELRYWGQRRINRAYDWAMREHLSAGEEPGDYPGRTKRAPMPEYVEALPVIEGIDFDGKGNATMHLRKSDGTRESITTAIPKS